MVEAGSRAKILRNYFEFKAKFLTRPITADLFDWGSPPHRHVLQEIEQSQDEVAKRLADEALSPDARR